MTPPRNGARDDAGSGGSDGDVDLQALQAQVEQNSQLIKALVHSLSRITGFTASELEGLRAD
jgi:hypothetical protein